MKKIPGLDSKNSRRLGWRWNHPLGLLSPFHRLLLELLYFVKKYLYMHEYREWEVPSLATSQEAGFKSPLARKGTESRSTKIWVSTLATRLLGKKKRVTLHYYYFFLIPLRESGSPLAFLTKLKYCGSNRRLHVFESEPINLPIVLYYYYVIKTQQRGMFQKDTTRHRKWEM